MSAAQAIVGAAGVGLIGANGWDQRGVWTQLLAGTPDANTKTQLLHVGAEVIGVGALVLLAGTGSNGGTAAVLIVFALWCLYLIHRHGTTTTPTTSPRSRGAVGGAHSYAT